MASVGKGFPVRLCPAGGFQGHTPQHSSLPNGAASSRATRARHYPAALGSYPLESTAKMWLGVLGQRIQRKVSADISRQSGVSAIVQVER
jgi:hypothetical protein